MEDNGQKLFELVGWFNNFSDQLGTLYKKIADMIKKNLKYTFTKMYVDFWTVQPHIASIYHMGFKANGFSIDIITNLDKNIITHKAYANTPSINCFKIIGGDGYFITDDYKTMISEDNLTIERSGEFITGKINLHGNETEFTCFQVPLEMFNGKDADEVIMREIITKIQKM